MSSQSSFICQLLARPLRWMPQRFHSGSMALVLNHLFAQPMASGDMDFLRGKVVAVDVTDLGVAFRLTYDGTQLVTVPAGGHIDVRFAGDAHAFLLLATQREDADSLFFQRQLRIEGDTACGLHLKNFLDALGESPLPAPARRALERFVDIYEQRCLGLSAFSADISRGVPQR
ncbi:MAG: SCP2 sterol-binding domain-containing protein [Gammaproteobacteria bacterium]|nr:SCP2 sterol-binding domain-containing protein [Gammaproteobacteria bacterium]